MDTKLTKNRNLVVIVICFCISIICADYINISYWKDYLNKDFYKSHEFENVLYEIATNSVYTVVGDNASEKMLKYKKETRDIISNHTLAQVFVINNDSKEVYSNNIFDYDKYMKYIKEGYNYPYIYEINFKQNTMHLFNFNGKERDRVSTKKFGNIAQTRNEDVTTYIAIPYTSMIADMKDTNNSEPLYLRYKQFTKNVIDANIFIGTKIIAAIIIVAYLVLYILENKDLNKKVMFKSISKDILLMTIAFMISLFQSIFFGWRFYWSLIYSFINTAILYLIYYIGLKKVRKYKQEGIHPENKVEKLILKYKEKNIQGYMVAKYSIIFIPLLVVQLITIFWYDSHSVDEFIIYTSPLLTIGLCIISAKIIIDKIKKIDEIKTGVSEIKNGNLEYKIEIKNDSLFNDIVSDINEISQAINIAVEERLKSERMKNELITNVSHDLKTPLTAMINYISLMKNENIQPEHVKDYVQVLDKRSQRLKVLIEDLFEASKVGSNSIELELEENDINQLLTQTLVEMEDSINESNLEFIINTPDKEIYILADGKKTFRVFENIVSNILKYSLEGTRVYIDLVEKDGRVNISFKNVSKYQLNFNPEEITERFTRGDLSRNTEGSGLGLAIAKGFVEAQDGNLKIDIIGDLFIVTIDFKLL